MTECEAKPSPLFENARAFFDHVVARSRAGHYPAAEPPTCRYGKAVCRYRTADGRPCVVGETIPDVVFCRSMNEAGDSDDLYRKFPWLVSYIPAGMTGADMLCAQRVHDRTASTYYDWNAGRFEWPHDVFVHRLVTDVPAFRGFVPNPE